jgi:hypothetical protein
MRKFMNAVKEMTACAMSLIPRPSKAAAAMLRR